MGGGVHPTRGGGDPHVSTARREVDWTAVAQVVEDGHRMALTGCDRRAAVLRMGDAGMDHTLIADRLYMTNRDAVAKMLERARAERARSSGGAQAAA